MKLSFQLSHLSITDFPTIEVPKFSLITGLNGSGKSHLLQAILAGAVTTDAAPHHRAGQTTEIRYFDASSGAQVNTLTDAEFTQQYGPAPWDFVNQALESAGVDFMINAPNLDNYIPYEPHLTKKSSGIEVKFQHLSSGEKVLMSFAFCVYYASDRRQVAVYPKVILLDEIDAPLHPSMSKSVVGTIINILVDQFEIHVIATTHSPSTVAIAPEESIYIMRPGVPGLHKTSKAEALNALTVGVPTLSISFDGRRQVFVESPADAITYELLYKVLKPTLASQRSLEFISTVSKDGAAVNTGCDVVVRLVNELSDAGNTSVFGLLDWDGRRTSDTRLHVLAEGRRNGLENVILDPLLIAALIARSTPNLKTAIGIDAQASYLTFISYDQQQLQSVVRCVCQAVLGEKPTSEIECEYVGGIKLMIDERYLTTDDHALEEMILTAFPKLNSVAKRQAGKLMQYVIEHILSDKRDFMPIEVKQLFERLLDLPAH
ncbi:AAA family ATPase [Microvirga flavescens]|uniref:AAA family ATPase n=1 Tax=Microvirga flavescens TaxID=2249811 RepID=UPI000DD9286A|nr:AAA family ATPase [Microvirga flavescens]